MHCCEGCPLSNLNRLNRAVSLSLSTKWIKTHKNNTIFIVIFDCKLKADLGGVVFSALNQFKTEDNYTGPIF